MGRNAPITVMFHGTPQAKARARFGRGHAYTPQATIDYQNALGWRAKAGMGGRKPIIGPVTLTALFELSVPSCSGLKRGGQQPSPTVSAQRESQISIIM